LEYDCTIYCPNFLKMLNSCPSKPITIFPFASSDIFEAIMCLLSLSPYPIIFTMLISCLYYRTTRGVLMFMMIFIQNFIVEFLKNNLKDPRPNYNCNLQYGNPSNHATFFTSFVSWVCMEYIM